MISYFGASAVGLVRPNNQDYFHIPFEGHKELNLFAVADGMGGQNAGEVASTLAISTFCSNLKNSSITEKSFDDDISIALRSAFIEANSVIYKAGNANEKYKNMGTTMTAALIINNIIYIAHVGDSRAYLVTDSKIKQLTVDHSYVQELLNEGIITQHEAQFHPDRNKITRALGTEKSIDVDIYMYSWQVGDVLLLCSDGLTNMLSNDNIFQIIHDSTSCKTAVKELISAAEKNGGHDNITAICIKNEGSND